MDWLLGVVKYVEMNYSLLVKVRMDLTPILRLNDDILAVIFEFAAEAEPPTRTSLGWVRLGHICSSWRQALLSLPSLWARDAYIFGPDIASNDMVARAKNSLVSVSAVRVPASADENLPRVPEQFVTLRHRYDLDSLRLIAGRGALRDLCVWSTDLDIYRPGDASLFSLLERIQPHLRLVNIGAPVPEQHERLQATEGFKLHPMASHPNLRRLTLINSFIPFALPSLVSLEISCETQSTIAVSWFDAMLDALESCPALTEFRSYWVKPPHSNSRRILLPRLQALFVCPHIEILEVLKLPALRRAHVLIAEDPAVNQRVHRAVQALFGHSDRDLRTMRFSQRVFAGDGDGEMLIMRFGWIPSHCPPAPPFGLPLRSLSHWLFHDKGSFISLAFNFRRRNSRSMSSLFSQVAAIVRATVGTDALEVLSFDNETREHTFSIDPEPVLPCDIMQLPLFPSVRTIELPLRDNHSTAHVLYSLAGDRNTLHLPLLDCLRFNGPLSMAESFTELQMGLAEVLRARRADVSPITSLAFDLSVDSFPNSLEAARTSGAEVALLKWTLLEAARDGLGSSATVTIVHETTFDPQSSLHVDQIRASIIYHT